MQTRTPEIRLISCTHQPIKTVFCTWAQSRPTQYPQLFRVLKEYFDRDVLTVDALDNIRAAYDERVHGVTDEVILEAFKTAAKMDLPVTECIHFTWGFANMPIEWREQKVRERMWGYWITSMREFGVDDFYTEGRWAPPVEGSISEGAQALMESTLQTIESAYTTLRKMDVPAEVARKIVPLCITHNGTMFSTYRTMTQTVAKRSCWIAQNALWAPVLLGMSEELAHVHHLLGNLISPPCFEPFSDTFKSCKYAGINENRMKGTDVYAPCPLYCSHLQQDVGHGADDILTWTALLERINSDPAYLQESTRLLKSYAKIWNRNPFSGKCG